MSNHLFDCLSHSGRTRPEAAFALQESDGGAKSYGGLLDGAARVAAVLIQSGLKPGDRVAAQVEKSLQAVELYLGTIMAGGVFLPLNTGYTKDEVAYFLDDAEPAVLVCDPASQEGLDPEARAAGIVSVLTLGADGSGSLVSATATVTPLETPVPRAPADLAAILYTSGTTGRSKGAMLSHENLVSNARALCRIWRFSEADVLIHALPIFHTHGLFVALNVTLVAGSSLVFLSRLDVGKVLESFSIASVLMGVPTFYTRLLAQEGLDHDAVRGMRLFVSGSAPLLPEIHRQWSLRTGHEILERYGMTETNMNASNPYDGARRPGTVGLPLPDVEIRITDPETGVELSSGEIGAIEVRGPNVFRGYWRMPEKTAAELRQDGWFITGDLGLFDEAGYLSIVGRDKDMVITGGYNVYPREIEEKLDALADVVESAVIGVPHPDFGEAVVAIVVPVGGAEPNEAAIIDALAPTLARFKLPKRVFLAAELPRNAMGKVQKNLLRERFAGTFA